MDFSGLLVLAALWALFNLFARSRTDTRGGRPQPRRPPAPPPRPASPPPGRPPRSGDPTQREGSQLEILLRELERTMGHSTGPLGRPAGTPLPEAEEVEERETLEEEPEIVSLEQDVRRPERPRVVRDEQIEQVVSRRAAEAERRSGALSRADHLAFDARIRREPADATAVRTYTPEELRQAVVWSEILGRPAALRDPGPEGI